MYIIRFPAQNIANGALITFIFTFNRVERHCLLEQRSLKCHLGINRAKLCQNNEKRYLNACKSTIHPILFVSCINTVCMDGSLKIDAIVIEGLHVKMT